MVYFRYIIVNALHKGDYYYYYCCGGGGRGGDDDDNFLQFLRLHSN
jgi:hypothetical protein